jgi:hypothetical protein
MARPKLLGLRGIDTPVLNAVLVELRCFSRILQKDQGSMAEDIEQNASRRASEHHARSGGYLTSQGGTLAAMGKSALTPDALRDSAGS